MITTHCQRWRAGRARFCPVGETIRTADYEVAPIDSDTVAREFVERHHYSGSYPAARLRFGLYRRDQLAGVAVLSVPMNKKVITNYLPCGFDEGAELGRLVLLDWVPANGESWFVARCFELARAAGIEGVVSFSDPVARTDQQGRRVFAGHVGIIYQALNARHYGRSKARTLRVLPGGQILSDRAISKIRRGPSEQGFEYACGILEAAGADPCWADRVAWLEYWRPRLTRPLRHSGNFRYCFGLDRRIRRHMPDGQAYPRIAA